MRGNSKSRFVGFVIVLSVTLSSLTEAGDWPMWAGSHSRNMVSTAKNLPSKWDVKANANIRWSAVIGSQNYGNPVIQGDLLLVGTNNGAELNPEIKGDKGVLMCFRAADGEFLWQAVHDKLSAGRVNDWPEQGICSAPAIVGDRIYYVSNRCELVCADIKGFTDGENDGPFKDEKYVSKIDGDFVWILDMIEELGAFPHNLATSSPLVVGDIVYLLTSNGVDEGHLELPAPRAPSFIAVNKNTGKVVWEDASPGVDVLHGQWSSPAYAAVNGKGQVVFPGGDGWLYAFSHDGSGNLNPLWKFDCNPKDSEWALGGRGTRNNLISTPVYHDGKVFIGVGQDPEHGEGPGHLWAIDAGKKGDVTGTGVVWHFDKIGRTMSTVAIHDGLLYVAELAGYVYCLNVETGDLYWKHDVLAAIWGSPVVADGKVFIGDEDGDVVVLEAGKEGPEVISEMNMGSAVYTSATAIDGAIYLTNRSTLFCIGN
jgi:outer membrane protein assembly factor BamB